MDPIDNQNTSLDRDPLVALVHAAGAAELTDREKGLIAAATTGDQALADAIVSGDVRASAPVAGDGGLDRDLYLARITAQGFRGIGHSVGLPLDPTPGLTVVMGRNGTGKSSFVDALEFALTGTASRWSGKKQKAWKDGWANLHHDGERGVGVALSAGGVETIEIGHNWRPTDSDPAAADSVVHDPSSPGSTFDSLGIASDAARFRPVLSYGDLSRVLEEGPAKLHDVVSGALGLESISAVKERLRTARLSSSRLVNDAVEDLHALRRELGQLAGDDRAQAVIDMTAPSKEWDLNTIESIVTGVATGPGNVSDLQALRRLPQLDLMNIEKRAASLREAEDEVAVATQSDSSRDFELASLLEQAIEFHSRHGASDCQVCGTSSVITDEWLEATRTRIDELRPSARVVVSVKESQADALRALRGLVVNPPTSLQSSVDGVSTAECLAAWQQLAAVATSDLPVRELADAVEAGATKLADLIREVVDAAEAELDRKADHWKPVAGRVAAWVERARPVEAVKPAIADLKKAEDWVHNEIVRATQERFAPVGEQVLSVWNQMRGSSSVSLDEVELVGKGTRRRFDLHATVDGTASPDALSVMSQGELTTLALSLFLPRTMLPSNPFKFIVLDDPVQALDGPRVVGLAQVLAKAAETHQVVVFTHDERFLDACRDLNIPVEVRSVERGARSAVTVTPA